MAVLPLRLTDEDIKALDALVKSGVYKNRSEAARALIRDGARVRIGETKDVSEVVRLLLRASKKKRERPFRIVYNSKSAVELVAQGRES
jgi:Arc/MetJ-type ribon-helix-helix transcriptional regulator